MSKTTRLQLAILDALPRHEPGRYLTGASRRVADALVTKGPARKVSDGQRAGAYYVRAAARTTNDRESK